MDKKMQEKQKIKIGIAPIGWTNDDMPELGGDIPFVQCIREMHEAEYEGCEIGSKFPKDPDQLLAAMKLYKLQIAAQWFSTNFTTESDPSLTINAFKKQLAFLIAVGAKVVVISPGSSIPVEACIQ